MPKVMMTLQSEQEPTLQEIRRRYNFSAGELDDEYGVVEIDPDDHLYAFRVEQAAAQKVAAGHDRPYTGPFADPKIETFGPPER